jgi:signal transduction histidine kinase
MPPIKILLVEDESIAALYTQKCLTILGYAVPTIVASGLEAIKQVEEIAPDLVLMDIVLAGNMDGIEAAQQIYDRFQTPVIYLTSYQDEAILKRAIVTKPYGYLLKPFNLSGLRVVIETAINKYQQEKVEQSRFDELFRLNRQLEQEITARKLAEEKVHRLNEGLEQRVAKRTAQLKEVQAQLVRREKLAILGQLAGGVSHELRNPLGVLSNAIYFLKIVLADADEMVIEYLNIISAEIRKSEKIVSDLLSFSRQREAVREQVSLAALTESELVALSPLPEGVILSNQLQYDLPPVIIDPQQIGQVLTNLVTNACQAMTDGGTLTLNAVDEGSLLALSVADTGPGIPPENLNKVFEPLFTTKARGIGLGLAVSKQLVEANQGAITVVSHPGEGCEFTVRLPIASTPEE